MTPSHVGPTDQGEVSGWQAPTSDETRLWPVYLADVMQEDSPRLFEIGDIVTWPVRLIDTSMPGSGWPENVPVQTAVSLRAGPYPGGRGRLALTPEFSVCWRGDEPIGSEFQIEAGLIADFFNPPFTTYVTGTVRRIAITSSPYVWRDHGTRSAWYPGGPWDLQDVRVAPLSFDHNYAEGPSARREHGLLVHLELITPRCRCQEIRHIGGERAADYARRHLQETGHDHARGTVDYVCAATNLIWRLDHPEIPAGWGPPRLRRLDDSASRSAGPANRVDRTAPDSPHNFADWWRETGEQQLRQLLYWVWDPLGVNEHFPSTADEYDRYAIEVATVLASGATARMLAGFLRTIERDRLGIAEPSSDFAATRLHEWYQRSRDRWRDRKDR